jgi:hypothetical protein
VLQHLAQIRKISAPYLKSPGEFRQPRPRRFNRVAISIASKVPSTWRSRVQDGFPVTTPTASPVGESASGLRFQPGQRFRHQNWFVII